MHPKRLPIEDMPDILLQKECFHLPPLAEQSRIVNCIDSLYAKLDSIGNEIL